MVFYLLISVLMCLFISTAFPSTLMVRGKRQLETVPGAYKTITPLGTIYTLHLPTNQEILQS